MTQPDPRIEAVVALLQRYTRPRARHDLPDGSIGWGASTADLLAAADVVDPARLALTQIATAAQHPYKGPNDTDASMLTAVAKRLDGGFDAGGQHTRATVARVLREVAAILDAAEGAR